jgi:hypothetical protein
LTTDRRLHGLALAALAAAGALSCASILGLDSGKPRDESADGALLPDGAPFPGDGQSPDGAVVPAATYHDLADPSRWSTFDLGPNNKTASDSYIGAIFDGRFVYLPPYAGGLPEPFVRYDTKASFIDKGSWQPFSQASPPYGWAGGVTDGRYVYYAPLLSSALAEYNPYLTRFDTKEPFTVTSGWTNYNLANVEALPSYAGMVFDGRYAYLVPAGSGDAANRAIAAVIRYDTTAPFNADASYQRYTTTTKDPSAAGYFGGTFDGQYVYFAPRATGLLLRYDTKQEFSKDDSWEAIALTGTSGGFAGAVYDGKAIYLAPQEGVAVRFDPNTRALATFKLGVVGGSAIYTGGTFDGRYVYFAPHDSATVVRYDTTVAFDALGSWTKFTVGLDGGAVGSFAGAGFDGRYVYFSPGSGSVCARFDAKEPPSVPPTIKGGSTL